MTRKAHGAICHCGAAVITGDDNDRAALAATVDPRHLTRGGELLAVIDGRTIYELSSGRLYRRDRWMLRGPCRHPVLAEHRCQERIPDTWRLPPTPPTPPRQETAW